MRVRLALAIGALLTPGAVVAQDIALIPPDDAPQVEVRAKVVDKGGGPEELVTALVSPMQWTAAPDPVKVSVAVRDSSLRDALREVFKQAKREYVVEEGVSDAKVSLEVHNVDLRTVLNVLSESTGIGWRTDQKDGKVSYRITKSRVGNGIFRLGHGTTVGPLNAEVLKNFAADVPLVYSTRFSEERSTFICPHCKGQATTVKARSQVRCPKCERAFQADWQFCPADGSKRPAASGTWKHCPFCGKSVG